MSKLVPRAGKRKVQFVIPTIGERVYAGLVDTGLSLPGVFPVPGSVQAIVAQVDELLVAALDKSGAACSHSANTKEYLYYNRS